MKLNKLIKDKSSEAQLILLNLPPPAKDESGDYHCILSADLAGSKRPGNSLQYISIHIPVSAHTHVVSGNWPGETLGKSGITGYGNE